jgi:hypothetical protein
MSDLIGSSDLLALVVTSMVFLAGFSSLRIHGTLGEKKRRVDEVVSSVTTTAGYAAALRRIDHEVSLAASDGNWEQAAADLAGQFVERDDPALTDRDLHPAAAAFQEVDLKSSDRVAKVTRQVVLGMGALVAAAFVVSVIEIAIGATQSWTTVLHSTVAFLVASAVWFVSDRDFTDLEEEYARYSSTLALIGLTPTVWVPRNAATGQLVRDRSKVMEAWELTGRYLGVPSDAVFLTSGHDAAARAMRESRPLVPEWSTPWQLAAHECLLETHIAPWVRAAHGVGDPDAVSVGRQHHRHEGIAQARAACQLNPLDPGCRTVLAALMLDQLADDISLAVALDRASPRLGRAEATTATVVGHGGSDEHIRALMTPLPLSETLASDPVGDRTRPSRWRISEALRCAREASILVQIQWGPIRGVRAAAGRITELDRIAVNYQLARGYALSALNDPDSSFSLSNATTARDLFHAVVRASDAAKSLAQGQLLGTAVFHGIAFSPLTLCLPSSAHVPDVQHPTSGDPELDWWIACTEWLAVERPANGRRAGVVGGSGIYSFADPWSQDFSTAGSDPSAV